MADGTGIEWCDATWKLISPHPLLGGETLLARIAAGAGAGAEVTALIAALRDCSYT